MSKITVIWADGREEQVTIEDFSVRDGILRLVIDRWTIRNIPLTSIREWTWNR